jgi:hypothetical protein
VEYILAYLCLGSARRWHELLHHRFQQIRPRQVSSMRFWLLEGRCQEPPRPDPGPIRVEPASWEDSGWLLERLEASSSPLTLRALDLVPEELALERVRRLAADQGYQRRRRLLTARWGGRRLAMAILESASEGLNPFRLFDSVRIVSAGQQDSPAAAVPLLNAARDHYRRLDKPSCVCFADDELLEPASRAGFQRIDEGLCWIIQRGALAPFLSHIHETLAPA